MGGYKEHKIFDMLKRKSIIAKYIVFITLIFIIIVMLFTKKPKDDKTTKDIVYIENSKLDYKVYLKENDFFEKKYLEQENQYIASLIDFIEANFKYELEASEKGLDYKYKYKIVAEVNVEDKTNHKSLYKFEENLIELKEYEHNTKTKLTINESIKVDYNRYNDIIKRFVDIYDLDNSNASVIVNMYVDILDDITTDNAKKNTPAISLTIPLTTDTMEIDIESNEIFENSGNICKNINQVKKIYIAIILLILDIILAIKLTIFMKDTKNEKAVYNMRLKKIMSNYGSYIQKLNNEYDFEKRQILEVKSFEDLLQIKEILNKPILMTEKKFVMETFFFIPNEDGVYVFELKAGNLRKNRAKRYKEKETIEEINKKRIKKIGMTEITISEE